MIINLKRDLISLLYCSGDIDNRKKGSFNDTAKVIEKQKKSIEEEYDLFFKHVNIKESVDSRSLEINEMIPLTKDEKNLLSVQIIEENFNEVSEDMLYIATSEMMILSYVYMKSNELDKIKCTLIFKSINNSKRHIVELDFNLDESREFFILSIKKYLKWIDLTVGWKKERNSSIKKLKFPFSSYRDGQEKLARGAYTTIAQNKMLFATAPTGIGKTISTVFPAVKAVGEGKIDKVFYLTAKTIGAKVAEESFDLMREQDISYRNITITAKDKVCLKDKTNCNPDFCEYAKNYYGRVNEVIYEILEKEPTISREIIEKYAIEYKLCPYELSLDLAVHSDAVICDYNYLFDPKAYIKRFFDGDKCNCTFLIDESHNLVDRAREMYSAEIKKSVFAKALKVSELKYDKVEVAARKVFKMIESLEKDIEKDSNDYSSKTVPSDLPSLISKLYDEISSAFYRIKDMPEEDSTALNEAYSQCSDFMNIIDLYDERYVFYMEKKEDLVLKLFCLDPSKNLKDCYNRGKSAVLFSATLSPMKYFRDTLGGDKESYGIALSCPFDPTNRKVIVVDNISTRYKDRAGSYDKIVAQINSVVSAKMGNYMIFAPSFDYMNKIKDKFNEKYPMIKTISQEGYMNELDREVYLSKFEQKPKKTMVSFNVVSGIFSEGIDLKGEKLIGSIIVSVGLPMVCKEREVIRDYFQEKSKMGFDFAYTYPGINKVIQSAGRVIRTDDDKGIVMLIDDRFNSSKYKGLFPKDWLDFEKSSSIDDTDNIVKNFWNRFL